MFPGTDASAARDSGRLALALIALACLLGISPARAQLLGPAPWLDPRQPDLEAASPRTKAVQAVSLIDTTSKLAVRDAYNQYYATSMPAMNWTGTTSGCASGSLGGGSPGTISTAFKEWWVTRINFLRAMAAVPGNVALNEANSASAQDAALMMSANNSLNHFPPSTWLCYTSTGYAAAGSSNLALGGLSDFLPLYMDDPGGGNQIVGHRRWILYSRQASVGVGNIPPGSQQGANALWVLTGFGPAINLPDGAPWPPRGHAPLALFPPSKRWSFSYPNANFAAANVTMTANGTPLALSVVSRTDNGYGDNTIVWEPVYTLAKDVDYQVTISGVSNTLGPTSFAYTTRSFDPADPIAVARTDFNLDGRSDVFWRDAAGGLVYQWQMNGLAISGQGYLPTVSANWTPLALGDVNGDGRSDVFWREGSGGLDYLWIMNGLGISSQGYVPSVPGPWTVVGMGDADGDLRADVFWRNPATGQNYLWIMNGLAITSQGYLPTVAGTDWEVVGVADYNGDARADVLWRDKATGQNYLWIMNGLVVSSQGYLPTVTPVDWEVVGSPDANGDGRADVMWRHKISGQNYLWLMNGLALSGQGYLPSVADANWKVVGFGDYNGDGRGDVLWRHATSGQNYLWTLNAIGVATQGYLPSVAGANWQPVKR